jgi:drug/metabolite transporter (DMT)-like permease
LVVIPLAHWLEGDRVTKHAIIGGFAAVAGIIGLTLAR